MGNILITLVKLITRKFVAVESAFDVKVLLLFLIDIMKALLIRLIFLWTTRCSKCCLEWGNFSAGI